MWKKSRPAPAPSECSREQAHGGLLHREKGQRRSCVYRACAPAAVAGCCCSPTDHGSLTAGCCGGRPGPRVPSWPAACCEALCIPPSLLGPAAGLQLKLLALLLLLLPLARGEGVQGSGGVPLPRLGLRPACAKGAVFVPPQPPPLPRRLLLAPAC